MDFGISLLIRACNAPFASIFSNGIVLSAVATGALPERKYANAAPITSKTPTISPARNLKFVLLIGFVCPSVLRSEEHTSELQSRRDLVCRLLLEKKKN